MKLQQITILPLAAALIITTEVQADNAFLAQQWYCAAIETSTHTSNRKFWLENLELSQMYESKPYGFLVKTSKPNYPVLVSEFRGQETFLPYKISRPSDTQFDLTLLDTSAPSALQTNFSCFTTDAERNLAVDAADAAFQRNQEIAREAQALAREKELKAKAEAAMQSALNGGADAKRAEQRARIVGDIQGYMQGLLQQAWRIPSTARSGMSAVAEINLFPSGDIDSATIVTSSGDQAFDRSVLQAIFRVERFDRMSDIDPVYFERSLRKTLITFRPNGLRW